MQKILRPPFRARIGRDDLQRTDAFGSTGSATENHATSSDWPSPESLPFYRGTGGYFSIFKLGLLWVTFLVWVKLVDWLGQDTVLFRQNYGLWNPLFLAGFAVPFLLMWVIPWFWLSYILMFLGIIVPPFVYSTYRNVGLLDGEKIFTVGYFRILLAKMLSKFGVKMSTEKLQSHELGPAIKFVPKGGVDEQKNQSNFIIAKQSTGFVPAKELLADMIAHRADQVMLDFTPQGVNQRFQIDGFWHQLPAQTREEADPLLAVLKKLGNANEADRRSRQEGRYDMEFAGIKYNVRLVSQGTETGERAVLTLTNPKKIFKTYGDLGMREKLIETIKNVTVESRGFVLVSAPAGGGFSTFFSTVQRECDRFLRDFVGVEDLHKREPEVENVHYTFFDSKKKETPMTVIPELARKYPNAYVVSDLVNAETAERLCEEVGENRLVIAGIKAKDCAEALLRVLMLKVPAKAFAPVIDLVVNMRTARKLCEACRESYQPAPELLKKLGLPPAQVQQLYRIPTNWPEKEPPCKACDGVGFVGRTGFFEVLVVGENTRKALLTAPQLETVRAAARKDGMRSLQEDGILLVAKGVTSLDELLRAMKS